MVLACQNKKEGENGNTTDEVAANYDRFPADGINVRFVVTEMDLESESPFMEVEILELLGRGQRAPGVADGTVLKLLLNGEQITRDDVISASVSDTLSATVIHTPRRVDAGDEDNMDWKLYSIN
jgi:hypothetical protein